MVGIAKTKETNDKVVNKLAAKYKIKVIGKPIVLLGRHNYENHTNRLYPPDIEGVQYGECEYCIDDYCMDLNVIQHESNDRLATNEQNGISNATHIGKLLYVAHATRPNIILPTITMALFAKNSSRENWAVVKRIVLRYLKLLILHSPAEDRGGIGNQSSPPIWMQIVEQTRTTNRSVFMCSQSRGEPFRGV